MKYILMLFAFDDLEVMIKTTNLTKGVTAQHLIKSDCLKIL